MSLRQVATSAAIWRLIQKWGCRAIRLAVLLVLIRLLAPESFGLVALASVFIMLGKMLMDQCIADAIVQRPKLGPISGTAVIASVLLLIQLWMPTAAGAASILVVSGLAGAVSYGAVGSAAVPEQCRTLWRLLAQRIPAYGARL